MNEDLKTRWWIWHKANREVYDAFESIAFELIQQGHTRYSSDAILHIVRFNLNRQRKASDQYKINNNWSPYYARLFQHYHPKHADFFETRELVSQEVKPFKLPDPVPPPAQPTQAKLKLEAWLNDNQ